MLIAAFAGTGKTTLAKLYPQRFVDFVAMPYKYHLTESGKEHSQSEAEASKANFDNIMQVDWPHNYIAAIKDSRSMEKILVIPTDSQVLELLRKENIEYSLYYPQREAKESYRERYVSRGNTDDFLRVFIDGWDRFIDALEADPCDRHVVMQSHEYLSDVISLLSVTMFETELGTDIIIRDEFSEEIVVDDDSEFNYTYSYGPDTPESIELGSKLSDVPKHYSNGLKPPKDDDLSCVAKMDIAYLITNTDALSTLYRLELLGKYLRLMEWKPRNPDGVMSFLRGRKNGLRIDGNVINIGDNLIDQESMEVLYMLDLLEKPIWGWLEDLD